MTASKKSYVYVIRDPRPGKRNAPIYVGKGMRGRAFSHLKKSSNRTLAAILAKCRALDLTARVSVSWRASLPTVRP